MPFLTQGKTNIKYLLIVIVLAAIVGGEILAWQNQRLPIFFGTLLVASIPIIYLLALYFLIKLGLKIFQIKEISRFKIISFIFGVSLVAFLLSRVLLRILGSEVMLNKFIWYPINILISFVVIFLFLKYYFRLYGKKLWQFLLYLIALSLVFSLVFTGINVLLHRQLSSEGNKMSEEKTEKVVPEEITKKETSECKAIQDLIKQSKCYTDLAKETKDESYCEEISQEFPEFKWDCYASLASLKNDASLCWKTGTGSLSSSCWGELGMKDWKTYRNALQGFEIKYPKNFYLTEGGRISNVPDPWPQSYGPHEKATIDIYRVPNYKNRSIDYLLSNNIDFIGGKKILIGGEVAVRKVDEEFPGIFTYFVRDDGYVYVLRGASGTTDYFNQYRELIKKIENTFKFIAKEEVLEPTGVKPSEKPDWWIYKNTKYKYTIEFPDEIDVGGFEPGRLSESSRIVNFYLEKHPAIPNLMIEVPLTYDPEKESLSREEFISQFISLNPKYDSIDATDIFDQILSTFRFLE